MLKQIKERRRKEKLDHVWQQKTWEGEAGTSSGNATGTTTGANPASLSQLISGPTTEVAPEQSTEITISLGQLLSGPITEVAPEQSTEKKRMPNEKKQGKEKKDGWLICI